MKNRVLLTCLVLLASSAARAAGPSWVLVHRAAEPDHGYAYFDERDGVLFALPGVSRSQDGGRTWSDGEAMVAEPDYSDVIFSSDKIGLASALGVIYISTDAGENWESEDSGPEDCNVPVMGFFDRQNGFGVCDSGKFIITGDGGRSWNIRNGTVPNIQSPEPQSVVVLDSQRAWVASETADPETVTITRVLRTQDGGLTWESSNIKGVGRPQALCFSDDRHGWLTAGWAGEVNPALLATEDGGRTWKKTGLEAAKAARLTSLACKDARTVWAAGPGLLLSSTNGGATWSELSTPQTAKIEELRSVGIRYEGAKGGPSLLFATYEAKGVQSKEGEWETVVGGEIFRLPLTSSKSSR